VPPHMNLYAMDPVPETDAVPATLAPPTEPIAPLPLLVTARRAAGLCGLSEATWWRLHASGKCPAPVKIGKSTRWRVEELRAWTEAGCPDRQTWSVLSASRNGSGRH
jgi:predicted DNA-binding transcriptional regulator AlpA